MRDLQNARTRRGLLLEFVNNCQRAPYPEGRSCDFEGGVPGPGSEGYPASDFNSKGKPNPGSDAWLDAHNISREVFLDRPYFRFEQGDTFDSLPDSVKALYEGEPEAERQLNKVMNQAGGFIMVRNSVPGSPEKGVVPQTRPDFPIVTDKGKQARAKRQWERAVTRAEDIKGRGVEGMVGLQEERVEGAKKRLEEAKVATRESYLAYATGRVEEAAAAKQTSKEAYLAAAGVTNIAAANRLAAAVNAPAELLEAQAAFATAQKQDTSAKRSMKQMTADADYKFGPNGEKTEQYRAVATANGEKILAQSVNKLEKYKNASSEEMADFYAKEVERADVVAYDAKQRHDDTAVKYVFPPNPARLEADIKHGDVLGKAGRVNAHGEENVKRLVEGKGRVYLAMEGCMKEDSLLTAVAAEGDETSSVISVPSVTLWRNNDMLAIAREHLRGREVVLIPDADGVNNDRVQNEARAMQSLLASVGVKAIVAPPPLPLIDGKPIVDPRNEKKVLLFEEKIKGSPKGTVEELKGVDDYLGVGRDHPEARGTLGNLAVQHREVPSFNIGTIVEDPRAWNSSEKALGALSNILGERGSGRVGTHMLGAAMGTFHDNGKQASRAIGYLEKAGALKVELVFDPDELAMGRRVQHPNMTEARIDELVKARIIERPSFGADDTRPVELGMKETPIITLARKYRAVDFPPTPLSSLASSKTNITKTRIKNLQRNGKTLEEIADLLDVSVGFLSGKLK